MDNQTKAFEAACLSLCLV